LRFLSFKFGSLISAGLVAAVLSAANAGSPAEYLGGTLSSLAPKTSGRLDTRDPQSFLFQTRQTLLRIPYARINQIEYGQRVDRRVFEAIVISPLFLLAKKRAHFLTLGYENDDGQQQAMVFRVEKDAIRPVLVSLEARTGVRVVYQDPEARKGGKG